MQILKNSEKYTVFKVSNLKKTFVLKVSNRSPNKILREVRHIQKLKNSSEFLKKKIPTIISYGKVKRGINKHRGYYKMEFVKGPTLSDIFQKNLLNKNLKQKLFDKLSITLISETRKSSLTKKNSFNKLKHLINSEYKKILDKDIYKNLLNRKKILINNRICLNISSCLEIILKSKKIKDLGKNYKYISTNNHWNYHGGNIIIPKCKVQNLKIIDPDSSWKFNDPFFSLARLVYTFPHDTMEYDKYYLISPDFLRKNRKKPISFQIKYKWKQNIKKNYELIFKNFFENFNKKNTFKEKLNYEEFLRFNISLILCFLRGINANHEPKINFLLDKSNNFQNKGLYLYLFFLIYLNNFTKALINE